MEAPMPPRPAVFDPILHPNGREYVLPEERQNELEEFRAFWIDDILRNQSQGLPDRRPNGPWTPDPYVPRPEARCRSVSRNRFKKKKKNKKMKAQGMIEDADADPIALMLNVFGVEAEGGGGILYTEDRVVKEPKEEKPLRRTKSVSNFDEMLPVAHLIRNGRPRQRGFFENFLPRTVDVLSAWKDEYFKETNPKVIDEKITLVSDVFKRNFPGITLPYLNADSILEERYADVLRVSTLPTTITDILYDKLKEGELLDQDAVNAVERAEARAWLDGTGEDNLCKICYCSPTDTEEYARHWYCGQLSGHLECMKQDFLARNKRQCLGCYRDLRGRMLNTSVQRMHALV